MTKEDIIRQKTYGGSVVRLLSLLLCLSLAFVISCDDGKGAMDYQDRAIKAELTAKMDELEFTATLQIDREKGEAQRHFCLELHSPRGLSGMVVEGELSDDSEQPVSISRGELELGEKALGTLSGALTVLRAFSISESPQNVSYVGGVEAGMPKYERLRLIEFDSFSVFLDPDRKIPVKIQARADGSDTGICDMIIFVDKIELSE